MNRHIEIAFAAALSLSACTKAGAGAEAPARSAAGPAAPAREAHEQHGQHEPHEEHEASDLDKPVEELFALGCEHRKKTFECDECRYEVGVARAGSDLFEGGLLKVAKAEKRHVEQPIVLTGEIAFDERRVAHVSSQSEGVIRKVHVALGDKVRAGQPLLEIDSVSFGEAESAYLEAQATLELTRRSFERQEQLRKEHITSEKEFLAARQEHEAAQIRARTAGDRLLSLGLLRGDLAAVGQRTARARLVLRAPMDGTVLVLHAVPGEVAKSEESLAVLGDPSTLWVWADLYERDLAEVSENQARGKLAASIAVKAFPKDEFPGTVDFLGPTMDPATRTVKVRVVVANSKGKLRAGMFASVRLFLPGEEEVLALPRAAVLEDEGRSFAFVHHHGDYFVRRAVKVGREWAGYVELLSGLEAGATVVVEGAFLLKSDVLRSKMGAGCAD